MQKRNSIDVYVGSRLRQRRALLQMTETGLGDVVGISFNQIRGYERGSRPIPPSHLLSFAQALKVPVTYFFEQVSNETLIKKTDTGSRKGRKAISTYKAQPIKREALKLVRAFYDIPNRDVQRRIYEVVIGLGAS